MNRPSPTMLVTRQVEFSAAHRLHRPDLTEEENRRVFGKCANPYGHGHNYVLDVTVKGEVDRGTGMLIHFDLLKKLLGELVVAPLDHRHMNHDVAFLEGVLPTSENLLLLLWDRISSALPGGLTLYRLRLASTARSAVEYFGPHYG